MLADNNSDLADMYKAAIGILTLAPCNEGQPAPTTWSYTDSGDTAGDLACGASKNSTRKVIIWTNSKNQMVGMVGGSDLATLYQWWQKNG